MLPHEHWSISWQDNNTVVVTQDHKVVKLELMAKVLTASTIRIAIPRILDGREMEQFQTDPRPGQEQIGRRSPSAIWLELPFGLLA